jgi:thiosulfate dehydrogenase
MTRKSFVISFLLIAIVLAVTEIVIHRGKQAGDKQAVSAVIAAPDSVWVAPDTSQIPHNPEGDLIRYGRMLIASTSDFFGPQGKIAHTANVMNCQNCHLDAGTKPFGNNYGGVVSTYPKFRDRRNGIETVVQRINDCFQRSLNGAALDSNGREMLAIVAYMKWLGKDVSMGRKPYGSGIQAPVFLDRAADTLRGALVYQQQCARCHGLGGEGMLKPNTTTYLYPPLWGENSYNVSAGLYRLSRLAGYIKDNMPFGASYKSRLLSDQQAWDVAAYINTRTRPSKKFNQDWSNIALKPVDHPFGPYADSFSETQHKFGPFIPIQKAKDNQKKKKAS